MPAPVTASVTDLPESRVRLQAEVDPAEVRRRLEQAARALGRDMRVPGFRKGKVPPAVVVKRVGREAILDEAVRDSLGGWYAEAIESTGIIPIGEPELDMGELPAEGEGLSFSVEVGVRPTAMLGEYKGVEVGRREPEVAEADIDAALEDLREQHAQLETAGRAAATGDFVVVDFEGFVDGEPFPGGEGRDQMVELGSGRLVGDFEEQLVGAAAGDEREVSVSFPEDYRATELAGRDARFQVSVKEVKAKQLPELDDELAIDAAGVDSLAELREETRSRLAESDTERIDREFRELALDAAVERADVVVPDALVQARARELVEQMLHSLSHQGISAELYLQMTGKTQEELAGEAEPDAEGAVRREAVLAAVAEAEQLAPSEEELLEALAPSAAQEQIKPRKLLERLRSARRIGELTRDLAASKAADLIAEHAQAIPVQQAREQDKPFTPDTQDDTDDAAGAGTGSDPDETAAGSEAPAVDDADETAAASS